jgi:hypothetical protein
MQSSLLALSRLQPRRNVTVWLHRETANNA